jgi:hypothetical protein
MDPELNACIKKSMRKDTLLDIIRYQLKLISLTNSEILTMRQVLIKEAKPLFSDFWLNREYKNSLDIFAVNCFEDRILSLPKKEVFRLYSEFNELKNLRSEEAKEYLYIHFIMNLNLYYSLNGWFLRKVSRHLNS